MAAVTVASRSTARSGTSTAAGAPPAADPGGQISATSGDARATGLDTHNTVSNSARADVQVAGTNEAQISVRTSASVAIQDTGVANAESGPAVAGASGQPGVPSVPTTASVPSSGSVAVTGLVAQTRVANSLETNRLVPGNAPEQGAINIAQTQRVSVSVGGAGSAASGSVCATSSCGSTATAPTADPPSSATTQVVSGGATAQGLVSSTTVTTDADARVAIGGRNYAPIRVIIDALTSIANWGSGSARSGSAGTTSAGVSTSASSAAHPVGSGTAQAAGAQVATQVELSSSASVRVMGDNHNPINIVLNLATNLLSWGTSIASSGRAQTNSTGTSNGTSLAASGSADATGLQAQNAVNLKARASVVVDGDNYAPILIWILFNTSVDNRGWAEAGTGAVEASGPTAASPGAHSAQSGPATAIGDRLAVSVVSLQSASANGSTAGQSSNPPAGVANAVASTAAGSPTQQVNQSPTAPPSSSGTATAVNVQSGPATVTGMQASVDVRNVQTSACAAPDSTCTAANSAKLDVVAEPAPASGPPVPPLNEKPGGSDAPGSPGGSEASSGVNGASTRTSREAVAAPTGSTVLVNPWADFPARRLPPLPKQQSPTVHGMVVAQDLWGAWPDFQSPPVRGPSSEPAGEPSGLVTQPAATRGQVRPAAPAMADFEVNTPPPLTLADVDPWAIWPQPAPLTMPRQAAPAASGATNAASSSLATDDMALVEMPLVEPPAPPAPAIVAEALPLNPFVAGFGALFGLVVATTIGGTQRGRRWLASQWHRLERH